MSYLHKDVTTNQITAMNFIPPKDEAIVRLKASGTVSCGIPAIINTDGTVSSVTRTALTEAAGSIVQYEAGATHDQDIVYDSANDKVVVVYRDAGNSDYGTAVVGTVSGASISFGTPVVFESAYADNIAATFDSSNNKVVVGYRDTGNSNAGTAIIGTVSGTSISFGTAVVFESGNTSNSMGMSFDTSANKVVIAYRDGGNSNYGTAIVGTVSGTSISFGTAAVFSSATTTYVDIAYDVANNKHVIGYSISGSGSAKVATVSGTSISFGSAAEFEAGATIHTKVVNDPNINRVLIFYGDGGDNDKGKAVIGSVSSTSISFTGQSTFYSAAQVTQIGASFNTSINKVTISTRDNGGALNMFTSSVTTSAFTHGSALAIDAGITTGTVHNVHVPTANRTVIAYSDNADSDKGKALVYTGAGNADNLTSENYIGIPRGTAFQTGSAAATGTAVVFESAESVFLDIAFDSSAGKVVIAYQDNGDSGKGKAIVGTVDPSDNSISFGTAAEFDSGNTTRCSIGFDSSNNKVVIAYRDGNNSNYLTAIVGTVSGTSISFGSAVVARTEASIPYSVVYDTNAQRVVINYRFGVSGYGASIVGAVSGTSISFGTSVTFNEGATVRTEAVYDANAQKIVIVYEDGSNSSRGTAIIGTVDNSDNSISFGSETLFNNSASSEMDIAYDEDSQKVVIAYRDENNSFYGTAIVGTVSGTSISFGTKVVYEESNSEYNTVVYDTNSNKVVIHYRDAGASDVGTRVVGTVSGTSISFGTPVVVETGGVTYVNSVFDSTNNRTVAVYVDAGNSYYGTAIVFKTDDQVTTRETIADGGEVKVDIIGTVSENQIGLTAGQEHFIQNDGTLSTTADSPSVSAGTALSATSLLVKN